MDERHVQFRSRVDAIQKTEDTNMKVPEDTVPANIDADITEAIITLKEMEGVWLAPDGCRIVVETNGRATCDDVHIEFLDLQMHKNTVKRDDGYQVSKVVSTAIDTALQWEKTNHENIIWHREVHARIELVTFDAFSTFQHRVFACAHV